MALFLEWAFFVSVSPSYVSVCSRTLLLRSMTRSDLRFPLASGSPVGRIIYASVCPFAFCSRYFCLAFVGCCLVFILVSVSGVFSLLLRPPPWLRTALCWGVIRCIFSAFSSRSAVLSYFVAFVLPVLCCSPGFLRGVFWRVPSSVWGFSLSCLSLPHPCDSPMHCPFELCSYGLGCGLFPLCSSFSLVSLLRFTCFGIGHFLRFLVHLSSFPFFSFFVHFAFLFHIGFSGGFICLFSSSSLLVSCEVFFPSSRVYCVHRCCLC